MTPSEALLTVHARTLVGLARSTGSSPSPEHLTALHATARNVLLLLDTLAELDTPGE